MKKLSKLVLVILLAACTASPATKIPALPTGTPDLQATGTAQVYASWTEMYQTLTPQPPQDTHAPTATETLLTDTPAPAEATPTPIPTLQPGQPVALTNLHMIDATTGWSIESSGHILHTNDGGNTWQDVTPPQGVYNEGGFFALDANTAWASPYENCYGENCAPFSNSAVIWRTNDGGTTWQTSQTICLSTNETCKYNYALPAAYYDTIQMQFLDKKTGWLLVSVMHAMMQDRYRIYHTTDSGINWELSIDSLRGPYAAIATGLGFLDKQTGWFGVSQIGGIEDPLPNWYVYKTVDSGHTWEQAVLPKPASLPATFAKNTYWCGASKVNVIPPETIDLTFYCKVYEENSPPRYTFHFHSFNGGQSWQSWQETGGVDFINATQGWKLSAIDKGKYNLEQTSDGGAHWTQVKTIQWSSSLDFVSEMEGWALATSGKATTLVHTKDGGKTWEELKPVVVKP